ncbi:LOW QUALITY PROTEIN: NADH dehydrogenase [ubiquinone] 1 beta subcomplex subunit 1-like [Cervus canadensis]|uniref:LOW QUALITY PROTEIN: NADH dehydrogenase [ubiquinone] 1 beta subcomplex subunit 1-like n=1 Tax=Cervus canadensis TaxID=1574408 RepID=UPI001CA30DFD|nr:LOW QUALITY PROTEIN: NADH dehydrogenase [ubiquinone] 1 beta subcomplex subunit 1-like [Cervus canadensis]
MEHPTDPLTSPKQPFLGGQCSPRPATTHLIKENKLAPVAGLTAVLGHGVFVGSKAAALIINLLQVVHDRWVHILVPMEFAFGCYLDKNNDEKLTAFQNRSLLYKKTLKSNEEVTWK